MPEVTNEEVKAAIEQIGKTNDARIKALEQKHEAIEKNGGKVSAELKESLDKITKDLIEFEALRTMPDRLKNIEAAIKRSKALGDGTAGQPEDYKESKESYDAYLRKGKHADPDRAWHYEKHQPEAGKKSLSVLSDPDGGYMVHTDLSGRVIKQVFETSDMRSICSVQTIGTDALGGTYDDLTGTSGGWVGETEARTETSTPKIGQWVIPVHEQYAYPFTTQKNLDDSNIDPEAWLAAKIADIMGRTENTAFVSGDGQKKPRGFTNYASGSTLRTQVQRVHTGASADLKFAGLVAITMALKDKYRARGKWGMTRDCLAKAMGMIDTQGRPLWIPQMQQGQPSMLIGFPVVELNDLASVGASSESLAFADWMEFYQIVDRVGIRILRNPFATMGLVGFYTTKRTGGDVLNTEAGVIGSMQV